MPTLAPARGDPLLFEGYVYEMTLIAQDRAWIDSRPSDAHAPVRGMVGVSLLQVVWADHPTLVANAREEAQQWWPKFGIGPRWLDAVTLSLLEVERRIPGTGAWYLPQRILQPPYETQAPLVLLTPQEARDVLPNSRS